MSTSTEKTGQWKGAQDGHSQEWTIIAKVKPGRGPALREQMAKNRAVPAEAVMQSLVGIGNLHDARSALFENDTRFLFATVFDGDWDSYIDDWQRDPVIPGVLDQVFGECEGFPGLVSPTIKAWFAANGVEAGTFRSAYPDLTVQDIWKQQRVNKAFQEVLDSPEFRTALDDPANAALLASPAFQKLLDAGAS